SPTPDPNFPDFGHLRECSRPHAMRNAGSPCICLLLPNTIFGKVPKWRLMTASPGLGQHQRPILWPEHEVPAILQWRATSIRVGTLIRRDTDLGRSCHPPGRLGALARDT